MFKIVISICTLTTLWPAAATFAARNCPDIIANVSSLPELTKTRSGTYVRDGSQLSFIPRTSQNQITIDFDPFDPSHAAILERQYGRESLKEIQSAKNPSQTLAEILAKQKDSEHLPPEIETVKNKIRALPPGAAIPQELFQEVMRWFESKGRASTKEAAAIKMIRDRYRELKTKNSKHVTSKNRYITYEVDVAYGTRIQKEKIIAVEIQSADRQKAHEIHIALASDIESILGDNSWSYEGLGFIDFRGNPETSSWYYTLSDGTENLD